MIDRCKPRMCNGTRGAQHKLLSYSILIQVCMIDIPFSKAHYIYRMFRGRLLVLHIELFLDQLNQAHIIYTLFHFAHYKFGISDDRLIINMISTYANVIRWIIGAIKTITLTSYRVELFSGITASTVKLSLTRTRKATWVTLKVLGALAVLATGSINYLH
jgi:hypothetical protein